MCSENLNFIDTWDEKQITPSTMKLYSKKIPAGGASQKFMARVRRQVNETYQIEIEAEDIKKSIYYCQDYMVDS